MGLECAEALASYERTLSDVGEFRVPGSTEAATEVLGSLARVLKSCYRDPRADLERLVRSAVDSRPSSQSVRNILFLFLEKLHRELHASGAGDALKRVDDLVREVEGYVVRARETASELASRRVEDGDTVLTHSYSTTILRLLARARERGLRVYAYVTESRPGGEGKLMASHLWRSGIGTKLVVDSAVRYVMKDVDKVFVSAEAIAANGAVVNKVGTSTMALAAKEARVGVYVVSGLYKFGAETLFGDLVAIEELNKPEAVIPPERVGELAPYLGRNLHVRCPLYDITPPEYIDAIITDRGLIAPQAVVYLARELFGWPKSRETLERVLTEVASLWK